MLSWCRGSGSVSSASRASQRLDSEEKEVLAAIYAGSDDQVLIGRVGEDEWWDLVARRLDLDPPTLAALRADVASAGEWNDELIACLRRIRGQAKTAIVSNAWPHLRTRLTSRGFTDLFDAMVLSCEVGYAKPDPRSFTEVCIALGSTAGDSLFVDDDPRNVEAAEAAGLVGYRHQSTVETVAVIEAFVRQPLRQGAGQIHRAPARYIGRRPDT